MVTNPLFLLCHTILSIFQGRPNEATKELKTLGYGELGAIDYLPGAEALKTTDELQELGIKEGKD